MRLRHRHFNPAHAGAAVALDSRFITGVADGNPLSAWEDRSANNVDFTASGTDRPTYNTDDLASQPGVAFSTSNLLASASINWVDTYGLSTNVTVVATLRNNLGSGTMRPLFLAQPGGEDFTYWWSFSDNNRYWDRGNVPAARISGAFTNTTSPTITSAETSASSSTSYELGAVIATGSISDTLNSGAAIMRLNDIGGGKGDQTIFQFTICAWYSPTLRKRLEHAAAYSFKLACN